MTCPQGIVNMAFTPFFRTRLQAGQIRVVPWLGDVDWLSDVDDEVLKCTGMSVLSESWCVEISLEAGQNGWSLGTFVVGAIVDDGVSEGTQKDGSTDFAA